MLTRHTPDKKQNAQPDPYGKGIQPGYLRSQSPSRRENDRFIQLHF